MGSVLYAQIMEHFHAWLEVPTLIRSLIHNDISFFFFFFQAEDGIRDYKVTGVQTCALPILVAVGSPIAAVRINRERVRAEQSSKQAEANERKAQGEAIKSQQVAEFLKDMLKGVGPQIAQGRDTTMLREIVDKTAVRASQGLSNLPEVEAEIRTI